MNSDVLVYFDDDLLASVVLDADPSFPWIRGTIVDGPAIERWRLFIERFHEVERALDFAPYLPGDAPYEESDTARYVGQLTALAEARRDGREPPTDGDGWLTPWLQAPLEQLEAYVAFLDWRRWRAVNQGGRPVSGIALPVSLDLCTRRISYRE